MGTVLTKEILPPCIYAILTPIPTVCGVYVHAKSFRLPFHCANRTDIASTESHQNTFVPSGVILVWHKGACATVRL